MTGKLNGTAIHNIRLNQGVCWVTKIILEPQVLLSLI